MNHFQATRLLSDAPLGRLSPRVGRELEAHLAECQACRECSGLYALWVQSFSDSHKHLSSQDLCVLALEPDRLTPVLRRQGEEHLDRCSACSEEVELVRAAVGTSQPTPELVPIASRVRPSWAARFSRPWARLALAATAILAFGALLVVGQKTLRAPKALELVGRTVQGVQRVEASESILVESTAVESGSVLNLESDMVAFGNGFSMNAGATLVAGARDVLEVSKSVR